MLLDRVLPRYDAARVEHTILATDIESAYRGVLQADFVHAAKSSPGVRFLFATRELGERAISAVVRRPYEPTAATASLRLEDMTTHGDWVRLGEDPPREIAFGVIGRFWGGKTTWRTIHADEFTAFAEPGFGKIACNFSLRGFGTGRTLVSYECRVLATDADARTAFLRYWRALSPFIGFVMRSALDEIEIRSSQGGHQ